MPLTSRDRGATMIRMFRGLVVLAMLSMVPRAAAGQERSTLHIKVVLTGVERKATPVPRHALLISDNPATAAPRRVVTTLDGSADVRLAPGNYTVESDAPVAFEGKAYQWTQTLDVVAGRDAVLELTVDNAEIVPLGTAAAAAAQSLDADPSSLLTQWQDSVVALWTPTAHASGFVIDAKGLVVTSQRAIGAATSVEVQLTPAIKVAAHVLAADPDRDVAVLWIDPATAASLRPVPLACGQQAPAPAIGHEITALEAPLRRQKDAAFGKVSRIEARTIASDLYLANGAAGGPVFAAGGGVVGIASIVDESGGQRRGTAARVVRVGVVCEVVASAETKMNGVARPGGAHLPVESEQPIPLDALKAAVQRRAGSLNPYQTVSSEFELAFMTPLQIYGPEYQAEELNRRQRAARGRTPNVVTVLESPLLDFSNWSDYVADFPPVLLVRVTPKQVEGFWTKVARGAAQTQGVAIPPIKRFKSGFLRMRAFCGDAEITPIHPFKLERRVSESDAIYEGLYAFDPSALGPSCGSVKLMLYSEKEPDKADALVVDPKVVQQIWEDFAPYRAQK